MSRNYKFYNPDAACFVSFAVVNWADVFIRSIYKNIVLDSLQFCIDKKGMEVFAWCIMSNHVHLVFRSAEGQKPEQMLGDIKRFTSKEIVKAIKENPKESRKEYLLDLFEQAGARASNVNEYQFWRHDNKPIELWSNKVIDEKINYVHMNPVEEGLVFKPEEYMYSSAIDYAGEKGLLNGVIIV